MTDKTEETAIPNATISEDARVRVNDYTSAAGKARHLAVPALRACISAIGNEGSPIALAAMMDGRKLNLNSEPDFVKVAPSDRKAMQNIVLHFMPFVKFGTQAKKTTAWGDKLTRITVKGWAEFDTDAALQRFDAFVEECNADIAAARRSVAKNAPSDFHVMAEHVKPLAREKVPNAGNAALIEKLQEALALAKEFEPAEKKFFKTDFHGAIERLLKAHETALDA